MLSRLPLSALLAANVDVVGVVAPAARVPPFQLADNGRSTIPIIPIQPARTTLNLFPSEANASPLELAARNQIPAFGVRDLHAEITVTTLQAMSPDLICVSCFPRKLPPAILQLPRFGCLNVHPSLLPYFRGPAPLFWTFQRGVRQTGVTIHWMDEAFDTGDIALQQSLTLPDGISYDEAEQLLAKMGGDLLVEAVRRAADGTLPRQPQPEGFAADPWPREADFALHTHWPVRRVFNFIRGTAVWERPYFVTIDGQSIRLRHAVAYHLGQKLSQPLMPHGRNLAIQFSDGVLQTVVEV